jgi:hypothetical protein
MLTSKQPSLTRLIVRFPAPLYKALKAEAEATSVPMAILVRQLVARWADDRTPQRREAV